MYHFINLRVFIKLELQVLSKILEPRIYYEIIFNFRKINANFNRGCLVYESF